MKLISLDISSFGKIKDFHYDFTDGVNSIIQENGWGKTTFTYFIKAMFYGVEGKTKKSISQNERKRFKPWGSTEKYGGSITFSLKDKKYKIERFFGSTESEDVVNLIDLDTGKVFEKQEDLGKRIFNVDRDGFFSTVFFSENDFEIKSNSSLTAKFNSTFDSQDSSLFDSAINGLEERLKKYKALRGEKGLLVQTKNELYATREKLQNEKGVAEALESIKEEVSGLEIENQNLLKKEKELSNSIEQAALYESVKLKKERYNKLLLEKAEISSIKEKSEKVLKGKIPTNKELDGLASIIDDLFKVDATLESAKNDVNKLQEKTTPTKTTKFNPLFFVGLGVGVVSIILFFINLLYGAISLGLGIVLTLIGVVFKPKVKENDTIKALIDDKQAEIEKLTKVKMESTSFVEQFLGYYELANLTYKDALRVLIDNVEQYKNSTLSIEKIDEELSLIDTKDFIENQKIVGDLMLLKNELSELKRNIQEKSEYLSRRKLALRQYEERHYAITDYESQEAELVEKLNEYQSEYEILNLTTEFLKQADENLRIAYRQPLKDSLNKYLSYITGVSINADIDVDLNVHINESSGAKDREYYSKGYQNIIEICKRLALNDIIFADEKPFIILDDPFYNLDEKNLKGALDVTKGISNDYQIIYLTCHDSRRI